MKAPSPEADHARTTENELGPVLKGSLIHLFSRPTRKYKSGP